MLQRYSQYPIPPPFNAAGPGLEAADSPGLTGIKVCLLWQFGWVYCNFTVLQQFYYTLLSTWGKEEVQERDNQDFCRAGDASCSSSPLGGIQHI